MTIQIAILFGIVTVALVLFWWDRFSPDVVALGVLLSLALTGLVPAGKASAATAGRFAPLTKNPCQDGVVEHPMVFAKIHW